uniref:Putative resistance protein n=1 Tax=Triticum turgidum TaxID=4571 RepID=Q5EWZ2_TRITU|nr:putative resistance protein [Triticum turgidum]
MAPCLVSASTGAMGSLLTKLETMLDDEYILLNVRRDIEFVIHELAMWQFLLDVADTEEPGQHDKSCADLVREHSYDIEDKIDNSMSLMLHHACPKSGIKKHMSKFKNLLPVKIPYQIAKDIKDIKSQILEVSNRCERYRFEDVCLARTEFVDPRLCTVDTCAADLVGIDGPKHELVKWLRNGEDESVHQQKVVSIVGCAGLGKTTLAKQVYDELRINFEYRAFVSISRSPNMATILKCVLSQFHAQDYSSDESEIPKLVDQIRDLLQDKRLVSSLSKLDAGRLSNLYVTFYLREKDGFIGHPFLPALNSIREVYLRRGRMCWMNKWLLSLANLEKLYISGGDEIEQDDLRTVGSIPTLVEFKLYSGCLGPIIISSGFEQLERLELKFSFSQLTFEVGAMPNLKKLDLHVYLSKFKSAGAGFDFGIQHLSSLACVSIVIFCEGVSAAYVEAAEGAFKSMVNAHPNPNRPMLEMTRESADFMSQDE